MKLWHISLLLVSFTYCFTQEIKNDTFKCGVKLSATGLIVGGTASEVNEWPWLASLVRLKGKEFICGGSIVSEHHVITAAHCIKNKRQKTSLTPRELLVYLGKHSLSALEKNSEWFQPYEILIHPDWETSEKRFDADLAILVAELPISITSSIMPICLWTELEETENYNGTVVGWGASESTGMRGHTDVPNQVEVRRVPSAKCYEDFHLIASIGSSRTFCASGVIENTGPCTGDSGGGFFVQENDVWFLQGIVSSSFSTSAQTCDVKKHSLYTKINEFLSWINLKNKVYDIVVKGEFLVKGIEELTYFSVQGLKVSQPSGNVVLRTRKPSKVDCVEIDGKTSGQSVTYLPNGFGTLFPSLNLLEVKESNLRFIEKTNFENMESLVSLRLVSNPIRNIPSDAFTLLVNLENLRVTYGELVNVHRNLIAKNTKLRHLDFASNQIETLPNDLFRNNVELRSLNLNNNRIKVVDDEFLKHLTKLQGLYLQTNIIQHVSPKAFSHLKSVIQIGLLENRLKTLHVETFSDNKELQMLSLSHNHIQDFHPRLFRNNPKLVQVITSFNTANDLPVALFENLVYTKMIILDGMRLKDIPLGLFSTLTSLEQLHMYDNKLQSLHKDLLSTNRNLTVLFLNYNKIESFDPSFFKNNLELKDLRLGYNQLRTISNGLFKNLRKLELLSLEFNIIETLAKDTFSDLENLKLLTVKDNNLKSLDEDLLVNLVNLELFYADSNQIEHLKAGLFRKNSKLTDISFNYNQLKKIDVPFDANQGYNDLSFYENNCINKRQGRDEAQAEMIKEIQQNC